MNRPEALDSPVDADTQLRFRQTRLELLGRRLRIEIRLEGYEPLSFEVRILPDKTITYKGDLRRRNTPTSTAN